MTGKNGAYLSRVEWEGLQKPWGVEDLAESPMLPPGSERIELRRDEQYRIADLLTKCATHGCRNAEKIFRATARSVAGSASGVSPRLTRSP